jgi:hypothetical protein
MAFRTLFGPLVAIPVAPIISGIIIHFIYTFYVSPYINSYILAFSFFLLHDISARTYCHIYQYMCFLCFVFNYYIWPICFNFSVFVYPLIPYSICLFL